MNVVDFSGDQPVDGASSGDRVDERGVQNGPSLTQLSINMRSRGSASSDTHIKVRRLCVNVVFTAFSRIADFVAYTASSATTTPAATTVAEPGQHGISFDVVHPQIVLFGTWWP